MPRQREAHGQLDLALGFARALGRVAWLRGSEQDLAHQLFGDIVQARDGQRGRLVYQIEDAIAERRDPDIALAVSHTDDHDA